MHYFDTSFLAPLFLTEKKSKHVEAILQSITEQRLISHWLRVEFSSLIARNVRMKLFNKLQASSMMEGFENLITSSFHIVNLTAADCNLASQMLQQTSTGLRAGDSLHLAIAKNHGAQKIYTLDKVFGNAIKDLTSIEVIS